MSRIPESLAPDLFARPSACPPYPAGVPTDVCYLFERLALQVARAGFEFYSARDLTAQMRWYHHIEKGNREFLMNNNWSPALARWFLARHPELPDFFETRGDDE